MKLSAQDKERMLTAIAGLTLPQIDDDEYTAEQLSEYYRVHPNTIRRWLRKEDPRLKKLFTWRKCVLDTGGHTGWAFRYRNGDGE